MVAIQSSDRFSHFSRSYPLYHVSKHTMHIAVKIFHSKCVYKDANSFGWLRVKLISCLTGGLFQQNVACLTSDYQVGCLTVEAKARAHVHRADVELDDRLQIDALRDRVASQTEWRTGASHHLNPRLLS